MKRRIISLILALATLLFLCACTGKNGNSTFSIRFIDVGQGDAALVECDGHYMLIDGGDTTAGDTVYNVLEENGIQRLDILAVSHLNIDHYGGLIKALTYVSSIGITLSNADYSDTKAFMDFEHQLHINLHSAAKASAQIGMKAGGKRRICNKFVVYCLRGKTHYNAR